MWKVNSFSGDLFTSGGVSWRAFEGGGEGEKKKKKKLPLLCVPRERGFQDSHRICVRG